MKKLIITMGLTLFASSTNAATTETVAKEFGLAMIDSLVEIQLQTACGTHISNTGKQIVTVDEKCISNINELLNTLETEPSASDLVTKVNAFMDANNIPKTFF
ncbi:MULTISPECIES: hypothetical protein [Vibrio]|uniref:hypothetical protein n=1 Tax=Vibrio TaxID=662 RepID=UPI000813538F|nr:MULTISPECIES: hypothetical protein [Vibrio]MCS0096651.1 hypothetical protein [Vibrio cholerae]NOI05794.1 hypothetical protein [Vibrio anguillarum]OCQ10570.1 hypothetical protein AKH09_09325 [Vibrio parahaemolyticus]